MSDLHKPTLDDLLRRLGGTHALYRPEQLGRWHNPGHYIRGRLQTVALVAKRMPDVALTTANARSPETSALSHATLYELLYFGATRPIARGNLVAYGTFCSAWSKVIWPCIINTTGAPRLRWVEKYDFANTPHMRILCTRAVR